MCADTVVPIRFGQTETFAGSRAYTLPQGFSPKFPPTYFQRPSLIPRTFPTGAPLPGPTVGPPLPNPGIVPTVDLFRFGDFQPLPIIGNIADQSVLSLANGYRIYLAVFNFSAANTLYLSFGQAASAASSIQIYALGGAVIFDAVVPQNDVHIAASADGTPGFIMFANRSA